MAEALWRLKDNFHAAILSLPHPVRRRHSELGFSEALCADSLRIDPVAHKLIGHSVGTQITDFAMRAFSLHLQPLRLTRMSLLVVPRRNWRIHLE